MVDVSNRIDGDWWLAKKSRIRANTSMPTISAATPMLLRTARIRTPAMLTMVEMTSVSRPRNCWLSRPGTTEGSPSLKFMIVERTSGTVTATAVTVTTPAQK